MKILFQILLVAFALATIGCSDKENNQINNEKLIATWFEKMDIESSNKYSVVEYVFHINGDYEVLRKVYNTKNDELLGYRFREVGNYVLNDDQLTFYVQETFVNDDSKWLYSDIEKLLPSEQNAVNNFSLTIKFENDAKTLVYIYPPCPPNVDCIERSVYNRR